MKVTGKKKLNKRISRAIAHLGISKAKVGKEYLYSYEKNLVGFKITEGTLEDEWFKEFVESKFEYQVKNQFIFSLLHECGHANANDEINGELYDYCLREKERIVLEMKLAETTEECKKLEFQYFNLPDEIAATAWAVGYAKENPDDVERMWKKCEKALHKFYKKNLVG